MNYEETLKELEEILGKMESPDILLDDLMKNYKHAIELYNKLENYLQNYKSEIKIVSEEGLKDFDISAIE